MDDMIVYSDVKYCVALPFMWTSVVFRSNQEIDDFINALQKLKKGRASSPVQCGHVHLSDSELKAGATMEKAEIVFFGPHFNLQENRDEKQSRSQDVETAKIALGALADMHG